MKKFIIRPNKMRMVRPADGLLPAVLLAAALAGHSLAAMQIFRFVLFTRLFALASARGLRQAFAQQPSMRRVRGSVALALILQCAGAAAVLGIDLLYNRGILVVFNLACIGIGLMLNIEHVFYEYLHAANEGRSANLVRIITSVLMLGGLMMTSLRSTAGPLPYMMAWPLGASAAAAAVSAGVGLGLGGGLKGQLNGALLQCAPLSMLQSLCYTLMWLALGLIPALPLQDTRTAAPFFAGLMVYELCRAPFRRTSGESREMKRALLALMGSAALLLILCTLEPVSGALGLWRDEITAALIALILGAAAGFAMFGSF